MAMNSADRIEIPRLKKAYAEYNTRGPLGSTHNIIPGAQKSLLEVVNDRVCTKMSYSWKKSAIEKRISSMNTRIHMRQPSVKIERILRSVSIPVDACPPCREKKLLHMENYTQVRESIRRYFKLLDGIETGLVSLFVFDGEPVIFYTVMITRRPERYFGFQLDIGLGQRIN